MSQDLPDRARKLSRSCIHQDGPLATTLRELATRVEMLEQLDIAEGWEVQAGNGWVSIINTKSGCGQDFYPDRDPLIFAFLKAMRAAFPQSTQQQEASHV